MYYKKKKNLQNIMLVEIYFFLSSHGVHYSTFEVSTQKALYYIMNIIIILYYKRENDERLS